MYVIAYFLEVGSYREIIIDNASEVGSYRDTRGRQISIVGRKMVSPFSQQPKLAQPAPKHFASMLRDYLL